MTARQRLDLIYAFAVLHRNAFLIGIILLVLYVSCFLLAPQMGLYSDDFRISRQWGEGLTYDWNIIRNALVRWPHGRPLIGLQISIFGTLGWELGGVRGVYILGYVVLAANALFTFVILRQFTPVSVAFLGALMMVLYPGDAVKVTYIRTVQVQFVVLLFLAATWSYLKGHRIWPYLLIVWGVGLYETVLLPFFFVPAMQIPWGTQFLTRQIRHAGILILILSGVVGLRLFFGAAGLTTVSYINEPTTILMRSLMAVLLGTFTSAKLLILRCYTAVEQITWVSGLTMGLVGLVIVIGLMLALDKDNGALGGAAQRQDKAQFQNKAWSPLHWAPWVQLMSVGGVMWLAAYPFFVTFHRFPPTVELGRMTTPHVAAEIGITMVVAALAWMMLSAWTGVLQRRFVIGGFSVYFALLAGFQVHLQSELAQVWRQQKEFWRAVIQAAPDLQPGSLVVVDPIKGGWIESGGEQKLKQAFEAILADPSGVMQSYGDYAQNIPWSPRHVLPETPERTWYTSAYAESLPWNIQFILPQIVMIKNKEKRPARALWVWQVEQYPFMSITVDPENNGAIGFYGKPKNYKNMQGNIIWLEADNNYTFKRITGTKVIQGVPFRLKAPGPSATARWKKGPLYQSILEN